jgi:sugar O-acyltransferase (sialic acid O-acetyltransferase NeuD family)
MKDRLIIIGAGGHGKVVADIASILKTYKSIVFLDDNESLGEVMGFRVAGKTKDAFIANKEADYFVAIGNNQIRKRIQDQLEDIGQSIATLIHPHAIVGMDVTIGKGTVVMAGAVINSASRIGKGCIINTSTTLDHDNQVGDYVHISTGAKLAGTVSVGDGSWIGAGSTIINNINIYKESIIGAGAVVIRDVLPSSTVVGVPAKPIKYK